MIGAAVFDGEVYEEVERDGSASAQSALVVVLVSLAMAAGTAPPGSRGGLALAGPVLAGVAAWLSWAGLTYFVGVRMLPEPQTRADLGQLMRTLAFSSSPGLVMVLGMIPAVREVVLMVVPVWMLATMLVAVRHALDYRSPGRALAVCLLGWGLALAVFVVMGLWLGPSVS